MKKYYMRQEDRKGCWFACTMMVLCYCGKIEPGRSYAEMKEQYQDREVTNPETGEGTVTLKKMMEECGGNECVILQLLEEKKVKGQLHYNSTGTDLTKVIEDAVREKKPVILGLDMGKDGGHFVVAYAVEGNDCLIMDPLGAEEDKPWSKRMSLSSGNIATAIVVETDGKSVQ